MPEYMLPVAYVKLSGWPLTANGKLDRRALPAPDREAYVRRGYEAPDGPVEIELAQTWQNVLGVKQIGRHDDFFDLGGHSLSALKMISMLAEKNIGISISDLFKFPTISLLASSHKSSAGTTSHAVIIRDAGKQTPLFMVHDYFGIDAYASILAPHIHRDIPLYLLPSVSLDETPLETIEDMASRHVDMIRAIQANGPYRLLGWSFGGVLAYEISAQLIAGGDTVEFLGMLDSYYRPEKINSRFPDLLIDTLFEVCLALQDLDGVEGYNLASDLQSAWGNGSFSEALGNFRKQELLPSLFSSLSDEMVEKHLRRIASHSQSMTMYSAKASLPVKIHLFVAQKENNAVSDCGLEGDHNGWGKLLPEGKIVISEVFGNHMTMVQSPHAENLGKVIMQAIATMGEMKKIMPH